MTPITNGGSEGTGERAFGLFPRFTERSQMSQKHLRWKERCSESSIIDRG